MEEFQIKQGAEVPSVSFAYGKFLLISECSLSLCMCPQGADRLLREGPDNVWIEGLYFRCFSLKFIF